MSNLNERVKNLEAELARVKADLGEQKEVADLVRMLATELDCGEAQGHMTDYSREMRTTYRPSTVTMTYRVFSTRLGTIKMEVTK